MFANRKMVVATKHKKEIVIAPIFEKELGVKCLVPNNFDTNTFGTFTNEISRKNNAFETVKEKCLAAMKLIDTDLGMASEGSFGPHPTIFFANANEELLIFVDKKNNLEILAQELSLDTNFNAKIISNTDELLQFAEQIGFPSHGLILKKSENDFSEIKKDFKNIAELLTAFEYFKTSYGNPYVETDMRAMNNPTRMKVIEKAAIQLIEKIKSQCPKCKTPGFGITNAIAGLRCEWCNWPTKSTLAYEYCCIKCNFTEEKKYPNNKTSEDPMYCDFCNP